MTGKYTRRDQDETGQRGEYNRKDADSEQRDFPRDEPRYYSGDYDGSPRMDHGRHGGEYEREDHRRGTSDYGRGSANNDFARSDRETARRGELDTARVRDYERSDRGKDSEGTSIARTRRDRGHSHEDQQDPYATDAGSVESHRSGKDTRSGMKGNV